MSEGQRERRQFGALRIPAQLQVLFNQDSQNFHLSVNISQNGILVKAPHNSVEGDVLKLYIRIPPSMAMVEALGRIARRIEGDSEQLLGIQFLEMSTTDRDRWLEFMATVESLSTDRTQITTSSVMLEERKREGRNRQVFVIRFGSKSHLQSFVSEYLKQGHFAFPYTMTRTPGDVVNLVLVHPETDRTLEIEAQIDEADHTTQFDQLDLTFASLTGDQLAMLTAFLEGRVSFEETATLQPEENLFNDLSENEQTVLMDKLIPDES